MKDLTEQELQLIHQRYRLYRQALRLVYHLEKLDWNERHTRIYYKAQQRVRRRRQIYIDVFAGPVREPRRPTGKK